MKRIIVLFSVLVIIAIAISCNLDINTDPNRPTDTTISGAFIFPAAANGVGQRVATADMGFLNKWIGWWASSGTFSIDYTETTYNITATFGDVFWQNHYNVLFDLEQSRTKSLASGDTLISGASMILSSMLWQELVDVFENIPYSQALQYTKYPQPVYDKGQDIYNDLQAKLDLAISYMNKTVPDAKQTLFTSVDIVNKGDVSKWILLANTIKLRLLIRQSEMSGFNPQDELKKITDQGGVLQAGQTISVNPGYAKATNQQSPFYANYGQTVSGGEASPSTRANAYFTELVQDDRLFQYFIAVGNNIVGCTYGLATGNPDPSSGIGPGLANNDSQNQWLMTSIESLFLEAEAIERGWLSGSASDKYAQAVTESFVWLRVDDAQNKAADYLTSNPYMSGNIKNILLEKYKALCGIAPIQLWADLRRMGYDIIPTTVGDKRWFTANPGVNTAISANTLPARLIIAQDEYTTNPTNVALQSKDITKKMFWQK